MNTSSAKLQNPCSPTTSHAATKGSLANRENSSQIPTGCWVKSEVDTLPRTPPRICSEESQRSEITHRESEEGFSQTEDQGNMSTSSKQRHHMWYSGNASSQQHPLLIVSNPPTIPGSILLRKWQLLCSLISSQTKYLACVSFVGQLQKAPSLLWHSDSWAKPEPNCHLCVERTSFRSLSASRMGLGCSRSGVWTVSVNNKVFLCRQDPSRNKHLLTNLHKTIIVLNKKTQEGISF